jgi:hypothetical protein
MRNKQKILYGAGEMGRRAFEFYTGENPDAVYCFVDDRKHGGCYLGKPIISFTDFVKVHREYDIVVCIFDLFELLQRFEKAGIYDFITWDDKLAVPLEERYKAQFAYFRSLDRISDRPKILYGAGEYGELAFYYYGAHSIYAFADTYKAGQTYLGKNIVHPNRLTELQSRFEIVVCVKEYEELVKYLNESNITQYALFILIDDIRKLRFAVMTDNLNNVKTNEALSRLDFIRNPDYLRTYYKEYLSLIRQIDGIIPSEKRVVRRFLGENYTYGYFTCLRDFCGVEIEPFEAPSVHHGIPHKDADLGLECLNLIEAGKIYKSSVAKRSYDAMMFAVGPYIKYAESFYPETEMESLKADLGRTLTVFPVHSIKITSLSYDIQKFVEYAMNEAKNFDSIMVCMFLTDFFGETTARFRAAGARIATAGYSSDPSFVKRLKSMMLLSDGILTNGLGTHIPFALSLGVPVKFFPQRLEMHSIGDSNEFIKNVVNAKLPIETVLPTDRYEINDDILVAYESVAGFTQLKTKEELAAIFNLSKRIITEADYKHSKYAAAIRRTYRDLSRATAAEEKLQFRLMREALPDDYEDYMKKANRGM